MSLSAATLPPAAALRRRTQALAMLDAVLSPEWDGRYYSHDAHWAPGLEMGSMRNGQGDDWFALFGASGVAIKGLAHETPRARGGAFAAEIQRQVPREFEDFLREPAFGMDRATFCYWRAAGDATWHRVASSDEADDGWEEFLGLLVRPALAYFDFAGDYFEQSLPLFAVAQVYEHRLLTAGLVASLNPGLAFDEAAQYAAEIGYPIG